MSRGRRILRARREQAEIEAVAPQVSPRHAPREHRKGPPPKAEPHLPGRPGRSTSGSGPARGAERCRATTRAQDHRAGQRRRTDERLAGLTRAHRPCDAAWAPRYPPKRIEQTASETPPGPAVAGCGGRPRRGPEPDHRAHAGRPPRKAGPEHPTGPADRGRLGPRPHRGRRERRGGGPHAGVRRVSRARTASPDGPPPGRARRSVGPWVQRRSRAGPVPGAAEQRGAVAPAREKQSGEPARSLGATAGVRAACLGGPDP